MWLLVLLATALGFISALGLLTMEEENVRSNPQEPAARALRVALTVLGLALLLAGLRWNSLLWVGIIVLELLSIIYVYER